MPVVCSAKYRQHGWTPHRGSGQNEIERNKHNIPSLVATGKWVTASDAASQRPLCALRRPRAAEFRAISGRGAPHLLAAGMLASPEFCTRHMGCCNGTCLRKARRTPIRCSLPVRSNIGCIFVHADTHLTWKFRVLLRRFLPDK